MAKAARVILFAAIVALLLLNYCFRVIYGFEHKEDLLLVFTEAALLLALGGSFIIKE